MSPLPRHSDEEDRLIREVWSRNRNADFKSLKILADEERARIRRLIAENQEALDILKANGD